MISDFFRLYSHHTPLQLLFQYCSPSQVKSLGKPAVSCAAPNSRQTYWKATWSIQLLTSHVFPRANGRKQTAILNLLNCQKPILTNNCQFTSTSILSGLCGDNSSKLCSQLIYATPNWTKKEKKIGTYQSIMKYCTLPKSERVGYMPCDSLPRRPQVKRVFSQ